MTALRDLRTWLNHPNVAAFLHVIREGESSQDDSAYTVVNGGTHFSGFNRHPYHGLPTTQGARACGAYQFLGTTWAEIQALYGLPDFTPGSQDLGAVALIARRHAIDPVLAGDLDTAIALCRKEWTSLPGAAENHRYTVQRAHQVYDQYGGRIGPPAPVEERDLSNIPPQTPSPNEPRNDMADDTLATVGKVAATVAGAFFPGSGLLIGLASSLIDAFTPLAKEKIASHFDNPTVGAQVADGLITAAKSLTGKADAIEAVAAARADPSVMAQLESNALDQLSRLAPLFDQVAKFDQQAWEASEASANAAAERAKDDTADLGPMLVKSAVAMVMFILAGLVSAVLAQVIMSNDHSVDGATFSLLGNVVMLVMGVFGTIYAFRFGTSRSSAAKDVVISQIAARTK